MSDDAEAAELFGRWAATQDLLGRITEDRCADLARAFVAGFFYGQNPILRSGLRAARAPAEPSITCPACGMTSYNPNDVREGYCGNCHG